MSEFRILIYEDDTNWKDSFEYGIKDKIQLKGKHLRILHKLNGDTVMADLEWAAHLIMIDYDLVDITGDKIIELIDNDPDYNKTSIFFYSGGESIDSLKQIAAQFQGGIHCFTKEGDELDNAILAKV